MVGIKLGCCPYDKKPCPGTREGCLSWGSWQTGTMYDSSLNIDRAVIAEGCRTFKLPKQEMIVEEPKPVIKPKPVTKPKPKPKKAAKK